MKKYQTLLFFLTCIFIILESCKKEEQEKPSPVIAITDDALFDKAFESGFTFYMGKPDTLAFTPGGGGHSDFIRVKFNSTAQAALGADGRLPQGNKFPEGSLVVKEIYKHKGGALYAVAIMLKSSSDLNASSGWVWGEYYANRNAVASVANKGSQCVSCHSITASSSPVQGDSGNRDLVRTFGLR